MSPPSPPLDIVTVAIAAFTAMFGANVGVPLGTYAVIILGALGGAAWSASKREDSRRMSTLLHMVLMVGLAIICTVPLAEAVASWWHISSRWMFAPVAVVIAARPDWVVAQVKRLLERRTAAPSRPEDVQ
jgi:Ca2+/Na+ antiporter